MKPMLPAFAAMAFAAVGSGFAPGYAGFPSHRQGTSQTGAVRLD